MTLEKSDVCKLSGTQTEWLTSGPTSTDKVEMKIKLLRYS